MIAPTLCGSVIWSSASTSPRPGNSSNAGPGRGSDTAPGVLQRGLHAMPAVEHGRPVGREPRPELAPGGILAGVPALRFRCCQGFFAIAPGSSHAGGGLANPAFPRASTGLPGMLTYRPRTLADLPGTLAYRPRTLTDLPATLTDLPCTLADLPCTLTYLPCLPHKPAHPHRRRRWRLSGRVSRAAKGADCKSAGYAFVGSSPTSPTRISNRARC
jgi:hypothetical protein